MKTPDEIKDEHKVIKQAMNQLDYIGVERQRIEDLLYWIFHQGVEEGKKQAIRVTNNNDKLSQSYLNGHLVGYKKACEDIIIALRNEFDGSCCSWYDGEDGMKLDCSHWENVEIIQDNNSSVCFDCYKKYLLNKIRKLQEGQQ